MNDPPKIDVENFNTLLTPTTKVYIPNRSGHDFSDSLRYGTPEYITAGEVNRFSIGHIARKWAAKLVDSHRDDYILITSLTILTVIGAALFGYLHGKLNILIFRNGKYIARTIDLKELVISQKESSL
jgi:hypothetical protein